MPHILPCPDLTIDVSLKIRSTNLYRTENESLRTSSFRSHLFTMNEIYSDPQRAGLVTPEDDMTNYSPTILYIDGETEQRLFLAALLEYRGFRVRTARRALDALELIATERFDVVIVDYALPDMTGAQLAQEI
jgi:PleD family two-component response regulator